jgi:hypothetical protein
MACIFGQYVGEEDIEREYKEFTMDFSGKLSENSAIHLVKSSRWIFNRQSINSLFECINMYLPRYITGFMCKESETNQGSLQIGVGDDGILCGIPYSGNLMTDVDIADMINKVIKAHIICDNVEIIKQNIKFDIVELDYEPTDIPDRCPLIDRYLEMMYEHNIGLAHAQKLYDEWFVLFSKYMTRLTYLFNDPITKEELCEYIEQHDPNSNSIELIKSNYILEHLSHDELSKPKNDPATPYYWVCRWKDELVRKNLALKPKIKYFEHKSHTSPVKILQSVRPMIPYWMQNNKNMHLFILKFSFQKPLDKELDISYTDRVGNVIKCYRTIENTPCCMPF